MSPGRLCVYLGTTRSGMNEPVPVFQKVTPLFPSFVRLSSSPVGRTINKMVFCKFLGHFPPFDFWGPPFARGKIVIETFDIQFQNLIPNPFWQIGLRKAHSEDNLPPPSVRVGGTLCLSTGIDVPEASKTDFFTTVGSPTVAVDSIPKGLTIWGCLLSPSVLFLFSICALPSKSACLGYAS